MAEKLHQQLKELGSKLEAPPTTKDSLIKLLKQVASCLSEMDQSPPKPVLESMQPLLNAIVKPQFLKHQDREIKLLVATCICEITRITAPEAPYSDDVLKDIFSLIVGTFNGLSDTNGPSFGRRVVILETLARYRSCVVMLDLECNDLVNEMFSTFFSVARDEHPEGVLMSMQTIMAVLIEESEDVRDDLLLIILSPLGRDKKDVTAAARRLSMNLIEHCAGKLELGIKQFLISSMSGDNRSLNCQIDYHEVIYDIYRCAPQTLSGIVPYLTGELLTDQLDIRLRAVGLVGDLFGLSGSAIPELFQPIFLEFLKRLTDRTVDVRMSVLEHVKSCLLSNPFRVEAPQIIAALCDRLLDYDENIRKQVVAVICDVACHSLGSINIESIKLVAERLRDKSITVKRYTMERLAETYRIYCLNRSKGSTKSDDYYWIPGKILRCFYDKDFRSDSVESILCTSLFPSEFTVKDKVKNWVRIFSEYDKVEVKALEKILEQKQRLQQEMRRYLSLKQMNQENDASELQKKVTFCFRVMSRCFTDPSRAEENFQILDQLKDANIWKILTTLLDPNTTSDKSSSCRDELLKILGEKHRLYEFLSMLSLKCSYILFNKEHVKEILVETNLQKSAGKTQLILSCMNILVILARFSPLLLSGIEEDLLHLLEDDNEMIKEGVLHVLAKAGGVIREQLGVSSRSLDLSLERICIEGSRRQAKYAVHALASITKDDGLMSLSVLYKRLVDMLQENSHLPAVLQSLGCIAQTAMPVFETRESEIEQFIKKSILEKSQTLEHEAKECWESRSELCSLKIFGMKALVKSYLPVKDAHLRAGIGDLMGILKDILSFGEISREIRSSSVDKAHLRLAAAKSVLRLSKHWDPKIPLDLFYLTLRTSDTNFPQVRTLFLNKLHQYIKDRLLDPKYACAFLLDIQPEGTDFEEEKNNLNDIIQMCQQGKARQPVTPSDGNVSAAYPENILPYLVHALAHHPSFPSIDHCKDVKAFEPVYRQLYLFISLLVHGDEDGKSELCIKMEKETTAAVLSIFQSIRCCEDAFDEIKSKNLYAVCDLGLSVTNRLVQKQDNVQDLSCSMPLPATLFKPLVKKEAENPTVVDVKTWLADEKVMAHFGSLKLETNGSANLENTKDEGLEDNETDGHDMTLGKMIKRLKAKGAKARQEVNNESAHTGVKREGDVDILKMVREINSDNAGTSSKFESSNGHEYIPKSRVDDKLHKRKTSMSNTQDLPVPKRQRSSSAQGHKQSLPKIIPKVSAEASKDMDMDESDSSESRVTVSEGKSLGNNMSEPGESDLLVSCISKKSSSSKNKRKDSGKDDEEDHEVEVTPYLDTKKSKRATEANSKRGNSNSKSASMKKQKRKSISGLAKCTSKGGGSPTVDLIGRRIKVWWPMDKQFYEGVVKSFDTQKKKHVVLYEDGDVEVLRLEKERWELIDKDQKPVKRSNSSKGSRSKRASREQEMKLDNSRPTKRMLDMSPSPQARGKRTPRQKKGQPKIKALTFREEDKESLEKSVSDEEQSDKDEKSSYEFKHGEEAEDNSDEAREVEKNSGDKQVEDEVGTSYEAHKSDEEEVLSSDEKTQEREISEDEAHEAEKSDSEDGQADDVAGCRQTNRDAEFSDDEPLGLWKSRIGKSVEGK